MRRLFLAAAMLWAGHAAAAPLCTSQGLETLFACSFGTRSVTVCDMGGDRFLYSYGKPGKMPELELIRPKSQVTYTPWNGIGRTMWSTLRFDNREYGYEVGWSVEKLPGTAENGWLSITKDGNEIALKDCAKGTVESGLDGLWDRF